MKLDINRSELGSIRFIHIDAVNFQDFPVGGTLSFSKQLISQLKGEVALVGLITDEEDPVGRWFYKEIQGTSYYFFGIGRFIKSDEKPLIPLRLQTWFLLLFYLRKIRAINVKNVFTQSPHFLFALNLYTWNSLCFYFAGITNSVANSRFRSLRIFGTIYERSLFKILQKKASVILAAADQGSISDAIIRTKDILKRDSIRQFPTRFDPAIFSPADRMLCRRKLNIDYDTVLLVTAGRLSRVKGWQLLIDSVAKLYSDGNFKKIKLVFAGEGEDKAKMMNYSRFMFEKGIIDFVGKLSPEDVALYLNAADVFIMGSFFEGWPTALVEALACGCAIVTTNVSASKEIVCEDKNGYIVYDRDPVNFARMIKKATTLKNVREYSLKTRDKFSVKYLKEDLEKIWLSKL